MFKLPVINEETFPPSSIDIVESFKKKHGKNFIRDLYSNILYKGLMINLVKKLVNGLLYHDNRFNLVTAEKNLIINYYTDILYEIQPNFYELEKNILSYIGNILNRPTLNTALDKYEKIYGQPIQKSIYQRLKPTIVFNKGQIQVKSICLKINLHNKLTPINIVPKNNELNTEYLTKVFLEAENLILSTHYHLYRFMRVSDQNTNHLWPYLLFEYEYLNKRERECDIEYFLEKFPYLKLMYNLNKNTLTPDTEIIWSKMSDKDFELLASYHSVLPDFIINKIIIESIQRKKYNVLEDIGVV